VGEAVPLEKTITNAILKWLKAQPDTHARKVWGGYAPGEPDILCCRKGRMVVIEVKQPGRKPTDLQWAAMARWEDAGAVAFVAHSVDEVKDKLANP